MAQNKLILFRKFDFDEFKILYNQQCQEQFDQPDPVDDLSKLGVSDAAHAPGEANKTRGQLRQTTSENRLKAKAYFLQDQLIYKAILYSKGGEETTEGIQIPPIAKMSSTLMKTIIGRDYKPILEVFIKKGLISVQRGYFYGRSTEYTINIKDIESIEIPPEISRDIAKYQSKAQETLKEFRRDENFKTLLKVMSRTNPNVTPGECETFMKDYLNSLNKIKVKDEEGLNNAIEEKVQSKSSSAIYYNYIKTSLKEDKEIFQVDDQGRFYHILTLIKKELKHYLSIRCAVDASNSHPELFNYILLYSHKVENSLALRLSEAFHSIFSLNLNIEEKSSLLHHNVGKSLRNLLITNKIKEGEIADFSDDELEYMYRTTNGIFWDGIMEEHPELDRDTVKKEMFAEVFYSNKAQLAYKELGKMFARKYPKVYDEIKRWKKPAQHPDIQAFLEAHKVYPDKPTASLSISMMTIESNIFREALASLYRKRFKAVHIHDCIVIPDTGGKHQPSVDEVKAILLDEYAKYGLVPTLKAE